MFMIWHFALENDNYFSNYGIWANGLLVETCSKRYDNKVKLILIIVILMKIKMITQLPLIFWIRFTFFSYDIQQDIRNLSLVSKYLYNITDNIKESKNFQFRKRLIRIPSEFKNSSEIRKILHCFSDKWINDTRKTTVLLSCKTSEQIQVLSEAIPNKFLVSIRFSCKEIKEYNKTEITDELEKMITSLKFLINSD